jgi:hypothetical protein
VNHITARSGTPTSRVSKQSLRGQTEAALLNVVNRIQSRITSV